RIVQGVRQRLWLGTLDPLIASLLGTPGVRLLDKCLFGCRQAGAFARVWRHRHHVQVDTNELLRVGIAQTPGNKRPPIAPLGAKARKTEDVGHQALKYLSYLCNREPALVGHMRKAIPWQRWRYHRKGITRVAAVARRISERADDVHKLIQRSGPAM